MLWYSRKLLIELGSGLADGGGVAFLGRKFAGREGFVRLGVDAGKDVFGDADSEGAFVVFDHEYGFACFVGKSAAVKRLVLDALLEEAVAFWHRGTGPDCDFFG